MLPVVKERLEHSGASSAATLLKNLSGYHDGSFTVDEGKG